MLILTIISGAFALLSVSASAYTWIQSYDRELQLDKLQSHLSSLQSRIGNVKQAAMRDAREVAEDTAAQAAAQASSSGGGGGGLDMETLMPLMMGGGMGNMMGQQGDGAGTPQQQAPTQQEQSDPFVIGSGGRTNGHDARHRDEPDGDGVQ